MSFYTEVICKDPRFRSLTIVRDMALLEPVTRAAVEAIIADAAAEGITLRVSETYRSKERQGLLFEQGATQLKAVGVHNSGLAADFYKVNSDGHAIWGGDWSFLGRLAKRHGLIWGGDWGDPSKPHTFRDNDHVQRCAIEDQRRLFSGLWYPAEDYNPHHSLFQGHEGVAV